MTLETIEVIGCSVVAGAFVLWIALRGGGG